MLRDNSEQLFLDVGCGAKRYDDPQWIYLDRMIYPSVQKGENTRFVCADMTLLPFRDGVFSLVKLVHVIEHVNRIDGIKALRGCIRVMVKGARIEIMTPNAKTLGRALWEVRDLDHVSLSSEFTIPVKAYPYGTCTGPALLGWICGRDPYVGGKDEYWQGHYQQHRYLYNAFTLQKLLEEVGFCDVKVEGDYKWELLAAANKP